MAAGPSVWGCPVNSPRQEEKEKALVISAILDLFQVEPTAPRELKQEMGARAQAFQGKVYQFLLRPLSKSKGRGW